MRYLYTICFCTITALLQYLKSIVYSQTVTQELAPYGKNVYRSLSRMVAAYRVSKNKLKASQQN